MKKAMQLSDQRIDEILQWWREQPFWNKCLFALCHPEEWFDVISLDKADRKARKEMIDRIF